MSTWEDFRRVRADGTAPESETRRRRWDREARGRGPRRGAPFAASLAVALLSALTIGAATAPAIIVPLNGSAIGYQPSRATPVGAQRQAKPMSSKGVEYHGGPVMPSNANYTLYWAPAGAPEYQAGYQAGIDRYFTDLAHDSGGLQNTDSVLAQYTDKEGHHAAYSSSFAGALIDTRPYPANGCSSAPICLTDEQLRTEIASFVEANKLPSDLHHEYFLLTPPGVESCLEAAGKTCSSGTTHSKYCSYHGYINGSGGVIVYANVPDLNATGCDPGEEHPNGNASDATIGGGLAHEHAESVTDPQLNAWYDAKKEETGDKCRTFKATTEFGPPLGKAPNGANYNQLIDGDLYWYQQEWSNEAGGCVQRQAQLPTIKKVSPKSGPSAGGTSVTITGTGYAPGATVRFGEAPATGVVVHSPTSISAISPAGSVGTVDIRVTTAAGTSALTSKDHFKYKK